MNSWSMRRAWPLGLTLALCCACDQASTSRAPSKRTPSKRAVAGTPTQGAPAQRARADQQTASADAPVTRPGDGPTISLSQQGETAFEVIGLMSIDLEGFRELGPTDSAWAGRFAISVVPSTQDGQAEGLVPIGGTYSLASDRVRFTPRYALLPGVRYRAIYKAADSSAATCSAEFEIPVAPEAEPTKLVAIYPSSDRLPENLLKFYLHFSRPMARGEAYQRVHLLDQNGNALDLPFLELGEELWDREARRFTLFFDPGRIKRGLKPREEAGPVLEANHRYTLVVDAEWSDATGQPLAASTTKSFECGPADEAPPDPATWTVHAPRGGESPFLEVVFPEPLDHALLSRVVWVEDAGGQPVAGKISVTENETHWRFTPDQTWPCGEYRLAMETLLEDLAGNSIGRPFEVDELKPVTEDVPREVVYLPFDVR